MAISVDPGMLDYMRANSGNITVIVRAGDHEAVRTGLGGARRRILAVGHPDEPGEPFASYVSGPEPAGEGWSVTLDMADAEVYPGVLESVLDAVVRSLGEAGVASAEVSFPAAWSPVTGPVDDEPPLREPAPRPEEFPLPAGARLVNEGAFPGGLVSVFLVDAPADLVGFYSAVLPAQGYRLTGIADDIEATGLRSAQFRSAHTVGFERGDLQGELHLAEWGQPSPEWGHGLVRVDTWTVPG